MADHPGELAYVWNRVIADLSGTSAGSGTSLSAQQRAFLRLTRPLGLIDGTALLAAPSEFAKDAIARIMRQAISDALGRHLGFTRNPWQKCNRITAGPPLTWAGSYLLHASTLQALDHKV